MKLHTPLAAALAAALFHSGPAAAQPGDSLAWSITEDLTTEIGPRPAGSEAEARARAWAVARLKALGFVAVRAEPFTMQGWERGEERAAIVAPFPQPLEVTALGGSGATPAAGLTAELAPFASFAAMEAAPPEAVRGRIVFIDHQMPATQDGSAYGQFGAARRTGPAVAAGKGAAAVLIRSLGTDPGRRTHTGQTSTPAGTAAIPSAALSNADADQLLRVIARSDGRPVRMQLLLTPRAMGERPSGNVIAELPGRDPSLPPVLAACHLDSWDLGTGAIDDAAGCAIITAAAHALKAERPLRTIRLLWAGAEETGVQGGAAYAAAHGETPHLVAMESDFGAGRVWRLRTNFGAGHPALARRLLEALMPLGVTGTALRATGGADTGAIAARQKLPLVDLNQDGSDYFDLHHTAEDTLDKVDPAALDQNVAAWTATLRILANLPADQAPAADPAPAG